jgi:YVTN family beta-propeller protein
VALKLLAPELVEDERFRARFHRESRLAASIDHPHILPVYEAGEVDGQLYIAMRYVEGTDLKTLLREDGPLDVGRALGLCGQIADALDAAHDRGLIHRDIKPSNVLVARQGGREEAYLGDFGLVTSASDRSALTDAGRILGTIDYIAPEAVEGGHVDARSDLYSLGCLLYECLTGKVPFPRDSELSVLWAHVHEPPPRPSERRPELGADLDGVIAQALAKQPEKRYRTCGELVEAARAALPPASPRASRRLRALLASAALLAAGFAAVLALAVNRGESGPSTTPTTAIAGDAIQRIDPKTNELVATIRVPVTAYELAVGGGSVWAANREQNTIYRIDPEDGDIIQRIQGPGEPAALTFGAGSLWVLNATDGVVSRLDAATGELTKTIVLPTGSWPYGGPFKAASNAIWLSWSSPSGNAVRIEPDSSTARSVAVGGASVKEVMDFGSADPGVLWALASDPRDELTSALHRIEPPPPDNSESSVVSFSEWGYGEIAVDELGVWMTSVIEDVALHVDDATRRVDRVNVGDGPLGISLGEDAVWVGNVYDGTVSRIDPDTAGVVATIPVGPGPLTVAVGEGAVWVDVHSG